MLHDLTEHHFISQKQAKFFKKKKESLQPGECVLVFDFAENYSFAVQDAAQGFHWSNSQATIHPFVLYYVDPATRNVCHKSYACISNQMIYDTVTVYCFLQKLLKEYVMHCSIWYHLYSLKNVKNTHGGVLILVKLQASTQHICQS